MDASEWDWTRIVVDHIDVHASHYRAAYLLDPDDNNVEALYRDVGCAGHGVGDW